MVSQIVLFVLLGVVVFWALIELTLYIVFNLKLKHYRKKIQKATKCPYVVEKKE